MFGFSFGILYRVRQISQSIIVFNLLHKTNFNLKWANKTWQNFLSMKSSP